MSVERIEYIYIYNHTYTHSLSSLSLFSLFSSLFKSFLSFDFHFLNLINYLARFPSLHLFVAILIAPLQLSTRDCARQLRPSER